MVSRQPVEEEVIQEQLRLQRHRGSDASGCFCVGRGAIAQNRLSIIDLDTGDPPIANEDGTVGAVLNGEIYNFRELRGRLRRSGHQLTTRGDTEVIAHLAEDLSPVRLGQALDGMFAFAVWDRRRERLVLGRDRVGKKPLHYWASDGSLVFASEIKGVLAHPAVEASLNPEAIPAYLTFGYVPTPETFYEGVLSVPPGTVLTFEPGGEPHVERYWSFPRPRRSAPAKPPTRGDLRAAAGELQTHLGAAVERRLVSDVPLGAFLSGGIDSSAIVGLMSRASGVPVPTFTIGFSDDEGFDERPHARTVAQAFGTDHHEFVVAPDAVDLVERLVWHHDQPFGDSSAIPTYLLSELTRQHVTVALSGDGGDELFAGYERFAAAVALRRYQSLPSPVRRALRKAAALTTEGSVRGRRRSIRRFVDAADNGLPDAYLDWLSFVDEPLRRRLLGSIDTRARDEFRRLWQETGPGLVLDRLLEVNARTYLLDDLLVKADRMSMAHGLEVRSPFLDIDLLEWAAQLPPAFKLRGPALKRVLRVAMESMLPASVLARRKQGFGVPLDRWFREDLRVFVAEMLGSPRSRVCQHLARAGVKEALEAHRHGSRNLGATLWTLLTLEVFLRRHGW